MKQGKTLVELAQELTHINNNTKDYIVPVERMHAEVVGDRVGLSFENGVKHDLTLNTWSSGQLASYADIPKAYFDRLNAENPALLATNVNHSFERLSEVSNKNGKPETRMVRTVAGKVRGLLSSSYRIIDSYALLETILPIAQQHGLEVASSEITDSKLYLKLLSPRLKAEVTTGDLVQYGVVISTSDVGGGAFRVEPIVHRLVCLNGLIMNVSKKVFHKGKSQAEDNIYEILTDRTKELSQIAFFSQVRDMVNASLDPVNFEREVNKLRDASQKKITNFDLPQVVEMTMRSVGITGDNKAKGILAALASGNEGAGLTQWGLINSFTRAAHSLDLDYESSIEMERAAGLILELPKKDWARIADATAA